ncbi:hypothetical protein F1B92_02150 [Campylobacter sp. FMV-PI01]|uniref:Uncharacterized protein n=1 Tax=Campylobacter portucalensis TaxID=2608384 RepID=A0A6L5WJ26_9BACT|nr:hypothetical protein [Campylobacter portucalensis]MSN96005.1 hypothetical protein [Campylobacter portucalensis]
MNNLDKEKRVKYIRALERFVKSAILILKRDDFDSELFRKRINKNLEALNKVEAIFLDQPYTKALENFAKTLILEDDREILIKQANLLGKLKNSKNYRKDKHKTLKFKDEF